MINRWLTNIIYYGLFLSTMIIVSWLMINPYEGGLWSAFRASNFPKKDLYFSIFFSLFFLSCTFLLLYWGFRKKHSITMNVFVWGFILWLIAIALILIILLRAFSSIPVGMD